MKLHKDDKVMVMTGRDKGKTGVITVAMPAQNKVVVEGLNIAKRHTKPSAKFPRGGILEVAKPIDVSKLMIIDPGSGLPARVGYIINKNGSKERIFKVSAAQQNAPKKKEVKAAAKDTKESK